MIFRSTEIEPADIRRVLGDTFILEAISRDEYRFRLAGTRVCALYGREMKGKDFLSLWTGKDREAVATMLAAVTQDAGAAVFGSVGRSAHERDLPLEFLMLPVRQKGEGWTRVLGTIAPLDDPYWIGIHPILSQSISSLRLLWPDERPHFLLRGDQVARDDVEFVPTPASSAFPRSTFGASHLPDAAAVQEMARRRVGHLMVLDGGKSR